MAKNIFIEDNFDIKLGVVGTKVNQDNYDMDEFFEKSDES